MPAEFITKDSGERISYKTGMKRDVTTSKPMYELCTPKDTTKEDNMLYRWAMLMNRGAVKYGRRNWELACTEEELERFKGSALRHMIQWLNDWDSEEDHAGACFFNIQCAEYVKRRLKESKKDNINVDYERGYNKALENNNILSGDSAKEFIETMSKPITPEQEKFLNECIGVFENTKVKNGKRAVSKKTKNTKKISKTIRR